MYKGLKINEWGGGEKSPRKRPQNSPRVTVLRILKAIHGGKKKRGRKRLQDKGRRERIKS